MVANKTLEGGVFAHIQRVQLVAVAKKNSSAAFLLMSGTVSLLPKQSSFSFPGEVKSNEIRYLSIR